MEVNDKHWRITDFAGKIRDYMNIKYQRDARTPHYNTVDKWFKGLEESDIHYINRVAGEKLYDELDFKIGCFIFEGRDKGYPLPALFERISDEFECRPAPVDVPRNESHIISEQEIDRKIDEKLNTKLTELIRKITQEEFQKEISALQASLPSPEDRKQEQEDMKAIIQNIIPKEQDIVNKVVEKIASSPKDLNDNQDLQLQISQEIDSELRKRALTEWDKLPEDERFSKQGWFKKVLIEDTRKRDDFIHDYKLQHFNEVKLSVMNKYK